MSDPLGAVLWHLTMIDGFVAGPDDAMDWLTTPAADEPSPTVGGALAAAIPQAVGAALFEMELAGLEPATSWVRSRRSPN